jgi:hypothetical protein
MREGFDAEESREAECKVIPLGKEASSLGKDNFRLRRCGRPVSQGVRLPLQEESDRGV